MGTLAMAKPLTSPSFISPRAYLRHHLVIFLLQSGQCSSRMAQAGISSRSRDAKYSAGSKESGVVILGSSILASMELQMEERCPQRVQRLYLQNMVSLDRPPRSVGKSVEERSTRGGSKCPTQSRSSNSLDG